MIYYNQLAKNLIGGISLKTDKTPRFRVALRGGFSDRNGIKNENTVIQYNSLDVRTRTAIINGINKLYHTVYEDTPYSDNRQNQLWRAVLSEVYQQQVDYSTYYNKSEMFRIINETINYDDYDSVLTLFEFLIKNFQKAAAHRADIINQYVNSIFKKEYVGYRFINGIIVPITDNNEIDSIETALTIPFQKVTNHLNKALTLISDREHPDYANSIKESISAVEAICSEILGKSDTLGAALKKLEQKNVKIHPSLKVAFEKLYGYTSDAAGIRHAGQLGGKDATFDEAKFMLVSCSAFINYLKGLTSYIS